MANKVLVIGDAIIDTYILGKTGRISPEAPVPVIRPVNTKACLGGAGNVARNAAALGAEVVAIFAIGNDTVGDSLVRKLDEWGIDFRFLLRSNQLNTINKTRIIGNDQQIVRIDYNDEYVLTPELEEKLKDNIIEAIPDSDMIVVSDYGKGTCTETVCRWIINQAGRKPVIVDPKGVNWEKYRGASVITPNMKEINTFSGKRVGNISTLIEEEYKNLYKDIGVEYLLITRSEEGMSLIGEDMLRHMPVYSHKVYDVSGAGDTVVAALATYLQEDLSNIEESARIANVAAGLVVAKPGTAVVTKEEIQHQLGLDNYHSRKPRIYTLDDYDEVSRLIKFWRTAGDKIVTANGCFDILHKGHIRLLKKAKKQGDKLVVAVNSDASVRRLKGQKRPVNSEMDRAYIVASIDVVDAVVIFDPFVTPLALPDDELSHISKKARNVYSEAPMFLMKMIMPDVHVKGGDYKKEDIPEAVYARELVIVNLEKGYSTTKVIEKMDGSNTDE